MHDLDSMVRVHTAPAGDRAGRYRISQTYDFERYEELRALSAKILGELTDEPFEKIVRVFASETGYQTPKVDVRAVMFPGANQFYWFRKKTTTQLDFAGGMGRCGLYAFRSREQRGRVRNWFEGQAGAASGRAG